MGSLKQLTVGVLCGGQSPEHRVSLISAFNVANEMDRQQFSPLLIGIRENGSWCVTDAGNLLIENADSERTVTLAQNARTIVLLPDGFLLDVESGHRLPVKIDIVFPVLHGPNGEDGSVQGYLHTLGIPYVGADLYGCAHTMDKHVTKRLLQDAGIPVVPWEVFYESECQVRSTLEQKYDELTSRLGGALFIKPARMGSSLGTAAVDTLEQFCDGLKKAFQFDSKVLVEQYWPGREIECSVIGRTDQAQVSCLGEILPNERYYTYESKYTEVGAKLEIPAELDEDLVSQIQRTAITTFKAVGCDMLARVDFLVGESGQFVVNELNAMPGFTSISMYPKLWIASGKTYKGLITELLLMGWARSGDAKEFF